MNFKLTSIVTLVLLVTVFIIQNIAVIEVKFLFWSMQVSKSLFIFLMLLVGIIVGWLLRASFKHNKKQDM